VKRKEFNELRDLSPEELIRKELGLREELFNLQMQRGVSQLENPRRIRDVRKDVARIQTIIREQKIREAASSPAREA
jgi:large subunit ribosomal protein L29